jgi:hypothetical protein
MRTITRVFALTAALSCCSPLLAENLVASDLKALTVRIGKAIASCDIDTVVDRISPITTISGTGFAQGDMRIYRMNKTQYGKYMELLCAQGSSTNYSRTNEKISIDGDQATITADVAETWVIKDQTVSTKVHERAVVELIDGKLMLVQWLSNLAESNVASR